MRVAIIYRSILKSFGFLYVHMLENKRIDINLNILVSGNAPDTMKNEAAHLSRRKFFLRSVTFSVADFLGWIGC